MTVTKGNVSEDVTYTNQSAESNENIGLQINGQRQAMRLQNVVSELKSFTLAHFVLYSR